jgi:AcrR family transcriptional regulator
VNDDDDTAALAGLLEDDCARTILVATKREAMSVSELADACGVSEPTVYRRLDDIREFGLVEEAVELDADGHHRNVYRATVSEVTFDVDADGVAVAVARDETMADRFTRYVREM